MDDEEGEEEEDKEEEEDSRASYIAGLKNRKNWLHCMLYNCMWWIKIILLSLLLESYPHSVINAGTSSPEFKSK